MTLRPLENLSSKQRKATPLLFALHLVGRIREAFGVEDVSVLWVAERSIYHSIPGCDCWPESRDAFKYDGNGPVICHPPCGPWGKYRDWCHESIDHGIKAMEFVHRFGGVVEHPVGSPLFTVYGRGGDIERLDQEKFGHQARKPTRLYWFHK